MMQLDILWTTTSTAALKLATRNGMLLGTITIPAHCADRVQRDGVVDLVWAEPQPVTPWDARINEVVAGYVKRGAIVQSMYIPGAVELVGMELEDFEKIKGCSFAPSYAYLKSIIPRGFV